MCVGQKWFQFLNFLTDAFSDRPNLLLPAKSGMKNFCIEKSMAYMD